MRSALMASIGMTEAPRKLLDQVRDAIRLKHYSYRTVRVASASGRTDLRGLGLSIYCLSRETPSSRNGCPGN
jgi:hypothetical protein